MRLGPVVTIIFALTSLVACGVKTDLITYEQYEADERRKPTKTENSPAVPAETEKTK